MEEEYINFGDEQVSKQDLLKAIGDYKAYSSTQPWSAARKGAFDAVIELALNRGILGTRKYTNPDTGESMYYATFGGDPFDINTYDKNTRRGWQDAAGFIGRLAESLPTKKSIEEKKKKEEEERIAKLPTFNSNSFLSTLYKNISDKEFGGQAFDGKTFDMNRWNTLDDVRDEKTGAVGTDKRKEALAKYLENIDRDFNAEEYNWKDSPFKDADDFKSRLGEAITALRSPELDDDTPALNKLGINYKDWFNNRTGETMLHPTTGEEVTYGNYYRGLQAQKDAKIYASNAKAYNANLIGGLKWYGKGLTGSPLSPENSNLEYLNQLAAKDSWNGDELSQLVGTFKLAQKNNALENLSKEELATFGRFGNNPNRFKKIKELNGIYWDSLTNQIAKPFARGQQNSGVNFQDILNQNNPNLIAKQNQQKQEELKNKNLQHKWGEGLTDDMKADLTALGLDAVSAGSAFAPGYGTAVSALTGIGATLAGAYADRARGESWGSTLSTAGFGLSMDILGLVPGLGVAGKAAKMAKIVAKGAKWIGPALGGMAAMSYGPGAMSAFNKFTSGKTNDITSEELRDFTYAMRAIAVGGIRKAGSTYQGNRTVARAIKEGRAEISSGKQSASITTKNGQQIKLTDDEFKTLNSNASKDVKTKTITQAAQREKINMEGDEIEWKGLNPIKGRFKTSEKSSKVLGLNKPTDSSQLKWNTTSSDYKGIKRFSNENIIRNFTNMSTPNTGIWKTIKDRWSGQDILNKPSSNNTTSPDRKKISGYLENLKSNKSKNSNTTSNKESKINIPTGRSDERLNVPRQLALPEHPSKGKNYESVGKRSTQNNSVRENQKELNNFIDSYGLNSKRGNRSGGYDPNRKLDNGVYSINKNGVTAVLDKKSDNDITITFGDQKQHFRNLASARRYLADAIYNLDIRKNDISKTAEVLRSLKQQGVFKHGGTLTLDETIENFLKNNNI